VTAHRFRVLVVDDSAFARKVLRELLAGDPRIEVVDTASDGLDALAKIEELAPEVLTLDLMMPGLDGLSLLRALPGERSPSVVVVTVSPAESEIAIEALHAGAFDLVQKPTGLATSRLYDVGRDLVATVVAAGEARRAGRRPHPAGPPPVVRPAVAAELIVIGTSTGGPQALTRLLVAFPADLAAPIAIALHIPQGYTRTMAERLDRTCALEVQEAAEATELRPGRAVLAQGGGQLTIGRRAGALVALVSPREPQETFAPSVDRLFESAARTVGAGVVGVVLTGMGDDGLKGARAIREAGGLVLTEAATSCVVYGMPRTVDEAGLSNGQADLSHMAELILASIGQRRQAGTA
jgi:two-component system, chemotaxis family, protein-glutamate methylesterase/glutaminase